MSDTPRTDALCAKRKISGNRVLDAFSKSQLITLSQAIERELHPLHERRDALANCYMRARRAMRSHEKFIADPEILAEALRDIIRFCEGAGEKSQLLRGSVPTEITGG